MTPEEEKKLEEEQEINVPLRPKDTSYVKPVAPWQDGYKPTPETPVVDTQKQTGVQFIDPGKKPEEPKNYGNYDWLTDAVENYFDPMTSEQRERRDRAAYISSGVQNLGKAFGALGNMFVAQHGAPAQAPIKTADADKQVDAFREYADKQRNAYLAAKTQIQKSQDEAYDKKQARYLTAVKANNDVAKAVETLELRRMRIEIERGLQEAKQNYWRARASGAEEQARMWSARANEYEEMLGYKVKSQEALAAQRYSAADRNKAQADRYRNGEVIEESMEVGKKGLVKRKTKTTNTPSQGGGTLLHH